MLTVKNASGGYGKTTIIRNVSLEISDGEMVALLGRNGVGKTTTMKYICGLIKNKAGSVEIDNKTASHSVSKRSRQGLAYVPQGRLVFPRMTVYENIAVAAASNQHDIKNAIDFSYTHFPILKTKSKDMAGSLSGGQQQILSMARALATKPKFILLDEPTEGVQPSIIDEMAGILKEINQEHKLAILVAEQNLEFCLSLVSKVYVMKKGEIVLSQSKIDFKENKAAQKELLGV